MKERTKRMLIVGAFLAADGCAVGCARKLLEHVQAPAALYLQVTGLGISKACGFAFDADAVGKVKQAVRTN